LLRLASLNHVILYAQGPEGGVAIKEVRVFVEAQGEAALQPIIVEGKPEERAVTEQEVKERAQDAAQRFTTALTQALGASSSTGGEENDVARRFREALGGAQEGTPPASEGMESEAARRFREVLQQQLQQ